MRRRAVAIGGLLPVAARLRATVETRSDRVATLGRCHRESRRHGRPPSRRRCARRRVRVGRVSQGDGAGLREARAHRGVRASARSVQSFPLRPTTLERLLGGQRYIADRGLAMSVFLALKLGRPLLSRRRSRRRQDRSRQGARVGARHRSRSASSVTRASTSTTRSTSGTTRDSCSRSDCSRPVASSIAPGQPSSSSPNRS